jgi:hypothetical protein
VVNTPASYFGVPASNLNSKTGYHEAFGLPQALKETAAIVSQN